MDAIITTKLSSGLGDMYLGIYQLFFLQEELKKNGYNVEVKIDLGSSPYKTHGSNRDIFKRIFKLHLLDNVEILTNALDNLENNKLKLTHKLAYSYEHIHRVYVTDHKRDINAMPHVKDSWCKRDDLPKVNLLSDEVVDFCEQKYKITPVVEAIHYRVFSSDNEDNIERDLHTHMSTLNNIITNSSSTVFVATNKQLVKDYCSSTFKDKVYINPYLFPNVHEAIRELYANDDEQLFIVLRETLCDMYFLSHCNKIHRISNWFSAFLSFACLYNQTSISNLNRFRLY